MIDLYHQYMNWVWSDGNYWFFFLMPGIVMVTGGICLSLWHSENMLRKNSIVDLWAAGIRGFIVSVCVTALWPWVVISVLPMVAIGVSVWAFIRLIPPKNERIAKREQKVSEARGKLANARSH